MKFSIITPCLNSVGSIRRTVDSVMAQQVEDLEYLIMDGGSSDGTLEVAREYERHYPDKVRVYSGPDASMTEALNNGVRGASGEIIGSINADDWYTPTSLMTVAEVFERRGCEMVFGNTRLIAPDGAVAFQTVPWPVRFRMLWFILGCYTPESSVFYTRRLAESLGGFREHLKYTQDFDFYLRATAVTRPVWANAVLSNFQTSSSQLSATNSAAMRREAGSLIDTGPVYPVLQQTRIASALRVLLGVRRYPSLRSLWLQARHGRLGAS